MNNKLVFFTMPQQAMRLQAEYFRQNPEIDLRTAIFEQKL